jgi:hypothetical protein
MIFKLIQHPLFWLVLAGFFLGAAIAAITIVPERSRDPRKVREGKLTKSCLFLTGAVLCGTIVFFVPAPGGIPLRYLPGFFTGLLITGLGLRFKKAAGIPILVLVIAAAVFGGKALTGWNIPGQAAAGFTVLNTGGTEISLSVSIPGETEAVIRLPAAPLRLRTNFLKFAAPYLIFNAIPFYKITALLAADKEYPLDSGEEAPEFQKILLKFPGIRIESTETEFPPPEIFSHYSIIIEPDGRVSIGGP